MCVVSMVGDHFNDKWKDRQFPGFNQFNEVTRTEFEALKAEVLEMKALLLRAVEYDKRNNEPHCEIKEKIATLKRMADLVGVSLEDVFPKD